MTHGDLVDGMPSYDDFRRWEQAGFCILCQSALEWDYLEEDWLCSCMADMSDSCGHC